MHLVHWMLMLSVLMFASSVWFLVAGAKNQGPAAPAVQPYADVKQIMNGIVTPGSQIVYRAVSTVVSAEGTVETRPQNDTEWAVVGSGALGVAEAGRLMLEAPRSRGEDTWEKMTRAMIERSLQAYRATQAKDTEALLAAGEVLNQTCDSCHREYAPDL